MGFERILDANIIEGLKKESLYCDYLLNDIKNGKVFPAIRKNEIHFYYKGGRLFKYTAQGFLTNIFYIPVFPKDGDKEGDVNEINLCKLKLIEKFTEAYEDIKRRCKEYNMGSESAGVAELYEKYSYITSLDNIVLLDIELVLLSQDEDKGTDRIDILLLNKESGVLQAVEAKLYENNELKGKPPAVISQIKRYQDNIEESKDSILSAYNNYIKIVNNLFELNLCPIESINPNVNLIYFGFDTPQKQSKKFKEIKDGLKGISNVLSIGSASNANLSQVFSCLT